MLLVLLNSCTVPVLNVEKITRPSVEVVAENLLGPVGLALLPDGSLLVAEEGSGNRDESAGVTLVTPDGRSRRLVAGLFSSRDAGDLAGVPLVSVSPDGQTLYIGNFAQDHLWTLPVSAFEGTLPAEPYLPEDLGVAMPHLNNVRLVNPFDMTYDAEGNPVVSDASENGVATVNADGTTRFFHRFDRIPNPVRATNPVEAVPTGITRVNDEYYVTLFGGCPYPAGSGQLVAVDTQRNQRTVIDGLNLPIDIAQDQAGALWLLEFARFTPGASCFDGSGYQPRSGRLSKIRADGTLVTVIDNLNFPGAVLPADDGSLYVSEVFSGRVIRLHWDDDEGAPGQTAHTASAIASEMDSTFSLEAQHFQKSVGASSVAEAAAQTTEQFTNVASAVGLNFTHGAFQRAITPDPVAAMSGGLCWIDYNNDGWLDLYLVNNYAEAEKADWKERGGLPQNGLYRNDGGTFVDVSARSQTNLVHRGNGCVAADFNTDGWTDLYVTAHGPNALLWNRGDGTFREGGAEAGAAVSEWSSTAVVGDLNRDGWPDLFVGGYIDLSTTIPKPTGHFPQDYYGIPDRLFLNLGAQSATGEVSFREVTREVGLVRAERALGALMSDLDQDGDLDLYIANDGQPNRLYENQWVPDDPNSIDFRFADLTATADVGDSASGMGVAGGDYDGDGLVDLFVTNWGTELNALYRNQLTEEGTLTFQYSTYRIGMVGLGNNLTGWGTHLADLDHDGDLDILTVNGHVPVTEFQKDAQFIRFYRNRTRTHSGEPGRPGHFQDWTQQSGLEAIGAHMSRGSAAADYDNDGDLDIAVNVIGSPPLLLLNQQSSGNWLIVDPGAFSPGFRVSLTLPDGSSSVREVYAGSSYLASEDPRVHFGLGRVKVVPRMTIRWPNGQEQVFEDVDANQILVVTAGR